ncbi:pseudouridine synthase [Nonomuraea jabiensis]|uniref:pseudouridine synthase n=1 Tax=Nonomuraea jabiensis TaxID=882448 RepID=UPI003D71E103
MINRRSTPSGDGRGRGRTGGSGQGRAGRPAFRSDSSSGSRSGGGFRGGSGDSLRADRSGSRARSGSGGREQRFPRGEREERYSARDDRGSRYDDRGNRNDDRSSRTDDRGSRYGDRGGRYEDRNGRGGSQERPRGDRGGYGSERGGERGGERSGGSRDDSRGYGARRRDDYGDERSRGSRDERGGYGTDRRDERGGYGAGRRDDRSGYAANRRDDRGGYTANRRDDRGGYAAGRGDDRGGYAAGRREERGGTGAGRRDERSGYGAGRRDDRGGYTAARRDDRGGYTANRRDDRGGYGAGRRDEREGFGAGRRDERSGYSAGRRDDRGGYTANRRDDRGGGFRADRSGRRDGAAPASSRARFGRRDGDARAADRTPRTPRRDDVQTIGSGSPQRDRVKAARQPLRDRDFYPDDYTDERDTTEVPNGVRLQKVLAQAGVASRRACEEMIGDGRVTVNGQVVRRFGAKVDPATQVIHVDGKRIPTAPDLVYYALNKPIGVVSTMNDPQGRPCLADYVEELAPRLFHVGRLDTETEGLLLLTNDGELANRLTHPSYGVQKKYWAKVPGPIPRDLGRRLKQGIELEDGLVKADSFAIVQEHAQQALVEVVLHEGRKHVVRRMLEEAGHRVIDLARIEFGPVKLGRTKPGTVRALTLKEVGELYAAVKL